MRIVLTTLFSPWSAYSGGGQRSVHNLALALGRRGHDVTVLYAKGPFEQVAVPPVPYAVEWAVLPVLRSRRDAPLRPLAPLSFARRVRQLLRPGTVVHANGEEAALLPRLRRTHPFGLVVSPRYSSYPAALRGASTARLSAARLALTEPKYLQLGAALRGADLYAPPSRFAGRLLLQHFDLPEDRLRPVHNGIPEEFLGYQHPLDRLDGPLVFFGRFAQDKGADVLVDALALLGDEAPTVQFIGRGDAEAGLRAQAWALGLGDRVVFLPWMEHDALGRALADASLAVLPSRHEAFGLSVVSALAVGVPVVSTRVGGIPEIVEDGRSGLLVPPDDPAALAAAIRRLRRDPAEARRLGRAGRERARTHFTWSGAAERFEALYRTLLS